MRTIKRKVQMSDQNNTAALKKEAALQALEFVKDGMLLGLGTGSTATFFVEALAQKVKEGLKVEGVPTSESTRALASHLGIKIVDLPSDRPLDLTVDGADEVELGTLNLIKGLGGALLHEKIVASASTKMIVVVDESKLVDRLGTKAPLPVEIVQFGFQRTSEYLKRLGAEPVLRLEKSGKPFITDSGNYITDCRFAKIENPAKLADDLANVVGVVESGLFVGIASLVIAAKSDGVSQIERP
jgi:ribose 5-phosphate isomerase A